MQEAFLRVESYSHGSEVRAPGAMLARTAINLSIDHARSRNRSPFVQVDAQVELVVDTRPGPEESVQGLQRFVRMREGLDRLSPKSRRILLAQRLEGMSYKEIAQEEGISVAAVEKQIARAVLFLTEWMDPS